MLPLVLTSAGYAALVNAQGVGVSALVVAQIGLTADTFIAAATLDGLPGEFKRLSTIGGIEVDDARIHVSVRDDTEDTYELRGFGVYLDDGTLFASFSQPQAGPGSGEVILEKSALSQALLAIDISLTEAVPGLVTFGAANFLDPPASTERAGIVELATQAEVLAGEDDERASTPAGVAAAIAAAIDALVAGSPGALDTLNELAAALGDDENFAATVTNALALQAPLDSPALTGEPTAPTLGAADNTAKLATTAFVQAVVAALAARTVSGGGLATGGGDLTANRIIAVPKASAADVAAGEDDTKAVTPKSLKDRGGWDPGDLKWTARADTPAGWLETDGTVELIADYPDLYGAIGTRYGGNGVTTFARPDYRGAALRALDEGRGFDHQPARAQGSYQADQNKVHAHTLVGSAPRLGSGYSYSGAGGGVDGGVVNATASSGGAEVTVKNYAERLLIKT